MANSRQTLERYVRYADGELARMRAELVAVQDGVDDAVLAGLRAEASALQQEVNTMRARLDALERDRVTYVDALQQLID